MASFHTGSGTPGGRRRARGWVMLRKAWQKWAARGVPGAAGVLQVAALYASTRTFTSAWGCAEAPGTAGAISVCSSCACACWLVPPRSADPCGAPVAGAPNREVLGEAEEEKSEGVLLAPNPKAGFEAPGVPNSDGVVPPPKSEGAPELALGKAEAPNGDEEV